MVVVYVPGVWDLLHVGHLTMLERARGLGDRLIVGVPTDDVVFADKGAGPAIPHEDRLRMVAALKCVDLAAPYFHLGFLPHLDMFKPDVLAVGETWGGDSRHKQAEMWIKNAGGRFVKLPYYRGESTSKIKERIRA